MARKKKSPAKKQPTLPVDDVSMGVDVDEQLSDPDYEGLEDVADDGINLRSTMTDYVPPEPVISTREVITSSLPEFSEEIILRVSRLNTLYERGSGTKLAGRQMAGVLNLVISGYDILVGAYKKASKTDQKNLRGETVKHYTQITLDRGVNALHQILNEERARYEVHLDGRLATPGFRSLEKAPWPQAIADLIRCGVIVPGKPNALYSSLPAEIKKVWQPKVIPSPYTEEQQIIIDAYEKCLEALYTIDPWLQELRQHEVTSIIEEFYDPKSEGLVY